MTRAKARQQVLIADLQHRTRNLLAVVQSIARETLGQSIPVDAFNNRRDYWAKATSDLVDLADSS